MTSRVLLVEDASSFRKMLGAFLRKNNYEVFEAWSLASARRLLPSVQPTMMLLDLQLEDGDGYSLLREYSDQDMSILVISAREEVGDRVISLELGAEDYMVKPIDLRELLLRMRRIERLAATKNYGSMIDFGSFILDLVNRKIVRNGFPDVTLSHSEFLLARILMEADGKILTRETIARRVLGKANVASSRAVDVLVSKLRKKLDPTGQSSLIWSVRGEGYRFALERKRPQDRAGEAYVEPAVAHP
ncbi:MAG: response regulator transcription factor [Hyphomicrobiales bacterium]|nr:response regulator transcription factor [Hyphomicrobiales bacterium]